jgi:general secretion pathway protein I
VAAGFRGGPRQDPAGFTLLEVAVALAILGVGVVTVLELFSAALRMETAAGVRARAVTYAVALLDQTVARPDMKPESDQGQYDDGFRWERTIREAPELTDSTDDELQFQSAVTMYEIEVSVLWPQTESREGVYTLRTLRAGPRPLS